MISFNKLIEGEGGLRRLFGEKELLIIRKQINGVDLTQSEKNRLSRDIRPKFDVIKELSNFSSEFDLKKGSFNKKLIAQAVDVIKKDRLFLNVRAIILFGSVVKGEVTFRSDLDIAVIFDKIDLKESTKFRSRIMGSLNSKVDIEVFNILPFKIKNSIARNYKVLFKRKNFKIKEFCN